VRAPSDPGLAMTPASSGSMPRASSPNQFPRAGTPVPPERPSSSSIPMAGEASLSNEPVQLKRSGMAVFGWIMLILILVGGGGALAYVMLLGNKQEPTTIPSNKPEGSGSAVEDKAEKPDTKNDKNDKTKPSKKDKGDKSDKGEKDKTPAAQGSDATKGSAAVADTNDNKGSAATTNKTGIAKTGKTVALADKMTLPQMLETAKKSEASGDWDTLLAVYQKLEKAKGYKYPGYAVYKQAFAYFQLNDTTNAQTLAQKAATMAGNQKIDAKILYADTWFKLGDYQRAKDFYVGLRKQVAGDKAKTALITKKIALCNAKLKKPERDGLND
jgi:hypothetical protein